MTLFFYSVPNFDVITHQKTVNLDYLCLKSKFWITNWGKIDFIILDKLVLSKLQKIGVDFEQSILFSFCM